MDSGGVKTRYGVVEDARFKNIPRVAYRSSMGRYKIVGIPDAGRSTGSALADGTRNTKDIATRARSCIKRRLGMAGEIDAG
jgi:hypothetical protein